MSGDAIFSNVIDANSCSHDLDVRPFKTSKVDLVGRSMHLNTLDLEEALQDIPRRFPQNAQQVLRWVGVPGPRPRKIGAIKVNRCVDHYGNRTLSP